MKRKRAVALLLAATLLGGTVVYAADAGSAGDPLIALNWLKNTFMPNTVSKAEERINAQTQKTYDQVAAANGGSVELRVKRGDVLRLETGAGVTLLAGTASGAASGAIVDVTSGQELSGSALTADHRYLAAENTTAAVSVTSDTAVVRLSGPYTNSPSGETDYNALADALKAMGLFRGSDVGYGSGYELENSPTRIQGLIMFLRLLGEENAALAYTGTVQFSDVLPWAKPYVAYAYDKGYTKGVGVDAQGVVSFGTQNSMAAIDYMTFLLRALGYSEGADFTWLTSVADGQTLGVLTSGEGVQLTNQPFLRAQVAYLSYFSLSAAAKGSGETLLSKLISSGAVAQADATAAMGLVSVARK